MKKAHILQLFLIILSLLIVDSRPNSNLKKIQKKISATDPVFSENKKHSKTYYDELVLRGLKIHNLTQGHAPYPYYQKMDFDKDKAKRMKYLKEFKQQQKKRRLTETQTLTDLGFFGLIQDTFANTFANTSNKVMKFITNNIRKDDSRFILYPYPFEYTKKTNEKAQVNEGGVFTLEQNALKGQTFKYIQNISSVELGKAKGLYDIDIAILSIPYEVNSDLFYEANEYCNYFVTGISKTSSCLAGKEQYEEYKKKNPSKGAVVRVSGTDIKNDILFDSETNQLKFKLLIVPDYLSKNEETILNEDNLNCLNNEAITKINQFRELGGNIITSGKSGYILELMGIIPSGTYDINIELRAKETNTDIIGCESLYKGTPTEQGDFFKQLLCLGFKNKVNLAQTFKVNNVPTGFESLIKYVNSNNNLYYLENNRPQEIQSLEETFEYILVSDEDGIKGRIFLVNGNPARNTEYFENMRNIILYTMTRDFIYDLKIKFSSGQNANEDEDLPIPAGEEGVQLLVTYKFYNLFNTSMSNYKLQLLFANKIKIIQYPTGCEIPTEQTSDFSDLKDFDHKQYLLCQHSSVNKLNSIGGEFKLEITDYQVYTFNPFEFFF